MPTLQAPREDLSTSGTPLPDSNDDPTMESGEADELRRQVAELMQSLSSSRLYITSLENSIRGSDAGVSASSEAPQVDEERKKGMYPGLGLVMSLASPGGPAVPAPSSSLVSGSSNFSTGLLPHSSPMFDLRRKASGQLVGSQASDARAALALKLETQGQSEETNGGLLRKGVNRIPSSVVQSHISLADSTSPAKTRPYRSNSGSGSHTSPRRSSQPLDGFPSADSGTETTLDDDDDDEGGTEEILQDETEKDQVDGLDADGEQFGTNNGVPLSRISRASDTTLMTSPVTGIVSTSPPRPRLRANPSTQMISTLQQQVETHRQHLDRVKAELRASQRLVAQLTRQNEDLKDTKERMRAENDSLGVMITRKERLLSEVLERARTAESTASTLAKERKQIEGTTRKSLAEMKEKMEVAVSNSLKSEREAATLRDGLSSLKESWRKEAKSLRVEIKEVQDSARQQQQETADKQAAILKLVDAQALEKQKLLRTQKDFEQNEDRLLDILQPQLTELRESTDAHASEEQQNQKIAAELKGEIDRLTRLIRTSESADV
ncbi:hypothetical protein QFC21_001416 [Naganishia friedmannii]|uniref:Uncharacterized protein n=1 Tax=Naganishia friedmannii TaxID=89922 RepID=A0ACC2W5Y1_9TREE|nr:hypothetical protein QFC21_001416 [Naganishia friedmannii]